MGQWKESRLGGLFQSRQFKVSAVVVAGGDGVLKTYSGSFIQKVLKRHNGASFVAAVLKRYDGTWKTVDTTP